MLNINEELFEDSLKNFKLDAKKTELNFFKVFLFQEMKKETLNSVFWDNPKCDKCKGNLDYKDGHILGIDKCEDKVCILCLADNEINKEKSLFERKRTTYKCPFCKRISNDLIKKNYSLSLERMQELAIATSDIADKCLKDFENGVNVDLWNKDLALSSEFVQLYKDNSKDEYVLEWVEDMADEFPNVLISKEVLLPEEFSGFFRFLVITALASRKYSGGETGFFQRNITNLKLSFSKKVTSKVGRNLKEDLKYCLNQNSFGLDLEFIPLPQTGRISTDKFLKMMNSKVEGDELRKLEKLYFEKAQLSIISKFLPSEMVSLIEDFKAFFVNPSHENLEEMLLIYIKVSLAGFKYQLELEDFFLRSYRDACWEKASKIAMKIFTCMKRYISMGKPGLLNKEISQIENEFISRLEAQVNNVVTFKNQDIAVTPKFLRTSAFPALTKDMLQNVIATGVGAIGGPWLGMGANALLTMMKNVKNVYDMDKKESTDFLGHKRLPDK